MSFTLHDAAKNGSPQGILLQLAEGAAIDAPDIQGVTPLFLAIKEGHVGAANLLDRGADVEAPSGPLSIRPIHVAAMSLSPRMMATVLQYHPKLETRSSGMTPLSWAVFTGDGEVVRLLLEAGVDTGAKSTKLESVLVLAISLWKNSLLPMLLRHGADVNFNTPNAAGQTAVHVAAENGNGEAIRQLVSAGANAFATLAGGRNALHVAAAHGHVNAATALLDLGLNPLAEDQNRKAAVHEAVLKKKTKMFGFLIDRCTASMSRASKIFLAIVAAAAGHLEILKALDNMGFPILHQDMDGTTALIHAAYNGHKDVAIYLLRRGADPLQKTTGGLCSLDIAYVGHHRDVFESLQEAVRQRGIVSSADLFPKYNYPDRPSSPAITEERMALILSSKDPARQIHTNQEPPGTFLCNYCKSLDFRRGQPEDAEVIFFMGVAGIRLYASEGCKSCRFLSDCLARATEVFGTNLWSNEPESHLALHSLAAGAPLLLYMPNSDPQFFPSMRLEIFVKEGVPTWPALGIGRDISSPAWSEERVRIARNMIRDCITTHTECSYRPGPLPTRVIRVGSEDRQPRLYASNGEHAPYIALSHCWGNGTPLTTTTDTLAQRLERIPLNSLPKTFRDAIEITRTLGIDYLWVDSLCILQDSAEDWRKEAAKMKDVYANCHVMIAADDSPDSEGGCLPSTPAVSQAHAVQSMGPWASKVTAFIRLTNLRDSSHMEVCHRFGDARTLSNVSNRGVLNRRGWCLQERVLAPRILHFGQSEFGWECPTTVACECQGVTARLDRESNFKARLADLILREAQPINMNRPDTPDVPDIFHWMNIVGEFTRRQLTHTSDMLDALSGLATSIAAATGSSCICGLWDREFAEFLMWYVDFEMEPIHGITSARFKALKSAQGDSLLGGSKRLQASSIPSWTWASVCAPITFQVGKLFQESGKEQMRHIRNDEKLVKRVGNRVSMLELVELNCEADPLNRFGRPLQASIKVSGLTVRVTWAKKLKSWDAQMWQSTNGGLLVYSRPDADSLPAIEKLTLSSIPPPSSCLSVRLTADFEPDLRDEDLDVAMGDSLVLLFVIKDLEATVAMEYEEEASDGEKLPLVSGFPGVLLEGLVLVSAEPVNSMCREGFYQRIGIFTTADEGWIEVCGTENITIV